MKVRFGAVPVVAMQTPVERCERSSQNAKIEFGTVVVGSIELTHCGAASEKER